MPKDMPEMDFTTPAIIGLYSVAGIYIVRALRGSTSPVQVPTLLLVAGTSMAASVTAARVLPSFMCPKAELAPMLQTGISAGMQWVVLNVVADMETANTMVPVAVVSDVLGNYAASMVIKGDPSKPSKPKRHHNEEKESREDGDEKPDLMSISSLPKDEE